MTKKREPKYDPVDAIFFVNVRNRVRAEFKRAYPPHVKYKKAHQKAKKGSKRARKIATYVQVLPYSDGRYYVANQLGQVMDNAGGWGYKTIASAKRSSCYRRYRRR